MPLRKSRQDATPGEARVPIFSIQKKYSRALVWSIPNVLQSSASWSPEVIYIVSDLIIKKVSILLFLVPFSISSGPQHGAMKHNL